MLRPTEAKAEEARKKAHDLFQRDRAKDAEAVKEREKAFEVQSQKTAKLKALRLARDAAAAAVVVEKPAPVKKTKKAAKAD